MKVKQVGTLLVLFDGQDAAVGASYESGSYIESRLVTGVCLSP